MLRNVSIMLLLAAIVDASEASAMIFPLLPAQAGRHRHATLPTGRQTCSRNRPMQNTQSPMPAVENPHVPVYQTYALPPPKPAEAEPDFRARFAEYLPPPQFGMVRANGEWGIANGE